MYSFDVFDTLITRTTAAPQGIFSLMRDRICREKHSNGLDDYIIDNFYELRIHSEEFARKVGQAKQVEEITLQDIYLAMAVSGCLDDRQIDYLCKLEQEIEIASVVPVRENIMRLKELIKQENRIVLISDMYLSVETIRKMLLQADPVFEKIPLYVSSEYGKRKTTGNLYRFVQEKEKVFFGDWTHIGDNLHQDIEVPHRLGIWTEISEKRKLTEFEKRCLDCYRGDSKLEIMIGTASGVAVKRNKTSAYSIGYRFVGPILYSYAEWIVDQAVKKGINRLYFIARDGYLIKKVVDAIIRKHKIKINTKYIYGSRKAWRMASLSENHYNLYQLVFWSHIMRIRSLDDLANVLHVPLEKLVRYLPGGFANTRKDTSISCQELEYITRMLSENSQFREYHLQQLAEERKLVCEYLNQEVDKSDSNFAFVDVSGGGLTQGCLKELLGVEAPMRTFFFRMDRINMVEGAVTDTFMPVFLENNLTIEMICRAPHGQTKGYKAENGKIVPDLEPVDDKLLFGHDFAGYEKGVLDFTDRMQEIADKYQIKVASVKNVLSYMKYLADEPSKEILEYFASMPSNESGRGVEITEYAPRLSEEDIRQIFLMRTYEPIEFLYKGTALGYSVLRATEEEKALIDYYKQEHDGILGVLSRQETERKVKRQREHYGRAAFYPVRVLEKKIILYGAGKFGQDLYRRLTDECDHEIVLWVDQNADECRKRGLENVRNVSAIENATYDQIVIAVIKKELAQTIEDELCARGIARSRTVWFPVYEYPNHSVDWDVEKRG